MRAVGAIAVNQPSYLHDYGDEYAESLGDAVHDLQPWRDELDAGVRVVISSDSDVSSYRPLTTIANAMLRRTRDGTLDRSTSSVVARGGAVRAHHRRRVRDRGRRSHRFPRTHEGRGSHDRRRRHPLDRHSVRGGATDRLNPRARRNPVPGGVTTSSSVTLAEVPPSPPAQRLERVDLAGVAAPVGVGDAPCLAGVPERDPVAIG